MSENIRGHTPLSQVPSALFRAFTRRSDLTSSQTVGRWMYCTSISTSNPSVVPSSFFVSSGRAMFLHRYRGLDTLRFQWFQVFCFTSLCRVVHPHLKLIGSAETQTEPETNSWPTVKWIFQWKGGTWLCLQWHQQPLWVHQLQPKKANLVKNTRHVPQLRKRFSRTECKGPAPQPLWTFDELPQPPQHLLHDQGPQSKVWDGIACQ